jgi:dihydroflavonol-4-reductase
LTASEPIREGVRQNAVNAAFHDPRFAPLSPEELDRVDIEVSILTEPRRLSFKDSDDLLAKLRVNVDGVRHVVRAAADTGVRRIVLTSSAATIGEPDGVVADEQTPHAGHFLSHYARSKYLGEQAFFDEAAGVGIEAVAVNPSSVQGPGRADGSALLIRYALAMRRPVAIETTVSVVDIDDTARAHLLASGRGADGERYLINGATAGIARFVELLAEAAGRPIDPIILPEWAAKGLYPVAAVAALSGRDLPMCVEMLRTLLHGHRFDATRSIVDLGMAYTPLAGTLDRSVRWLQMNGFVSD